ncbi:helix-turn-helix domain-containing protein [Agrococcus sediminis]|uniref:helix-turn-helix domain-containing protein n=1 Tax=Agrococcus sediminis TaxID=2599924 RepID=UPI003811170F
MSTATAAGNGSKNARTYLPDQGNREQLLNFAEFMRELEAHLAQNSSQVALVDPTGEARPIPEEIFRILDQVTNALAAGKGITVVPQGMTMTTQQAADFLGVSRPTLVRLLESGAIPFEQPGRHRRVRLHDLLDYQQSFSAQRREALRDLARANLDATEKTGSPSQIQRLSEMPGE